jgi:predicted RNA-binding Zn-ribbon protein involved in translation (DUF1610 family)
MAHLDKSPSCGGCGASMRVTNERDRTVFYTCDTCGAQLARSVPDRAKVRKAPPSESSQNNQRE